MKLQRINRYHRLLFCAVSLPILMAVPEVGQAQRFDVPPDMNLRVRSFLQKFGPREKSLRYAAALVDGGRTQKEEVVVYLKGPTTCGTAGCELLILKPQGSSFQVIGDEITVKLPIRALHTESYGRRNIGVWVQWGTDDQGRENPGYEVVIRFDGRKNKYEVDATSLPANRLPNGSPGDILISENDEGRPVYGDN